ncbi:MAG: pectate lyase [Rikenellaceae bacterium]|jgi:pectinesterase|nr:pectate lyase [Rikenellaceae bacterium]
MRIKHLLLCLMAAAGLSACQSSKINVYTLGDSTVGVADTVGTPMRGWGQMLQTFLNADSVRVIDAAVAGSSSKTYYEEGHWKKTAGKLKPGDYVLIQFGGVDSKADDPAKYTDAESTFREYLTAYVNETREKGATPVLLTPVAKRRHPEAGIPVDMHADYSKAVAEVGKALDVPVIDLADRTVKLLLKVGSRESKKLYMWLEPGQAAKYPEGLEDDAHLCEFGAFTVARMVAGGIRENELPLADQLTETTCFRPWGAVAERMPDEWYGTDEAVAIAANVLLYQRDAVGWPKNIDMHFPLSANDKKNVAADKGNSDCTTDNDATFMEMTFLSKVFNQTGNPEYQSAVLRGMDYLLAAQYPNGGWPQYYPDARGYATHITYNDNAMVNTMTFLNEIARGDEVFAKVVEDPALRQRCAEAFDRGVQCILKTQYVQKGVLTAWCAQHDENTLAPAGARSYELPSLSGSESVGIVMLLMDLENPSPEVTRAIDAAIAWMKKAAIHGVKIEALPNAEGRRDRQAVADPAAPQIWARFYELNDNRPFFSDRDGIKKYSLAEIGYERRNGYSWYTYGPQAAIDRYDNLKKQQ